MKRFPSFLFYLLMMFLCTNARAQNKAEQVLYLKNGSVIHGTVLEVVPNGTVKIQTYDGNIFVYEMEEVDRITKDKMDSTQQKLKPFSFGVQADYALGVGNGSFSDYGRSTQEKNDYHGMSYRLTGSYRASPNFYFGLGAGYESYSGDTNYLPKTEYIPVFLHIKSLFATHGDVIPGFSLDAGYEIGMSKKHNEYSSNYYYYYYYSYTIDYKYEGGVFLNPSLNLTVKTSSKLSLCFNLGYEYRSHKIKETVTGSSVFGLESSTTIFTSNFIKLGVGAEF